MTSYCSIEVVTKAGVNVIIFLEVFSSYKRILVFFRRYRLFISSISSNLVSMCRCWLHNTI